MKVGNKVNVWITGAGPMPFRAKVTSTILRDIGADGLHRHVTSVLSVRIVAQDGRTSDVLLNPGQFILAHDQTPPEWEARP